MNDQDTLFFNTLQQNIKNHSKAIRLMNQQLTMIKKEVNCLRATVFRSEKDVYQYVEDTHKETMKKIVFLKERVEGLSDCYSRHERELDTIISLLSDKEKLKSIQQRYKERKKE
jgi:hypothetical protein